MCFKTDAAKSFVSFEQFSRHAMQHFFGDGAQIRSFENHANEVEKALDFAGIDGMIVTRDGTTYFYASRVQFRHYQSFSIRGYRPAGTTTEFAKLQQAIEKHEPMPTYHVQCFVDADEQAATVAVARTIDLVQYVENHNAEKRRTSTGEEFFVVPFSAIERIRIYRVGVGGYVEDLTADYSAA